MIEPIKALVICPHAETLTSAVEFLKTKEFEAYGASEKESALMEFQKLQFDIVIMSGGIDNSTKDFFKIEFQKINKDFEFIEHSGKPEAMLEEMKEAFDE